MDVMDPLTTMTTSVMLIVSRPVLRGEVVVGIHPIGGVIAGTD